MTVILYDTVVVFRLENLRLHSRPSLSRGQIVRWRYLIKLIVTDIDACDVYISQSDFLRQI